MQINEHLVGSLRDAGLSEKAARIYGYLLAAGGAYPSSIATATKLNRSTVYLVLTELSVQGLVNEVERGKKLYYTAEDPIKLVRNIERRAETATKQVQVAGRMLPDLRAMYETRQSKTKIRYFDGRDAVLEIYEDHVQRGRPYEML